MEKQETVKEVLAAQAARAKAKLPSYEQIIEALESGESRGFCLACGADAYGVEPDAQGYVCDECGEAQVFGAEECLLITVA